METLNEGNDRLVKPEKGMENVSNDIIKELFTEMFKVEEETIRKIVSSCNTDTIARLDRLTEEIQDSNEKLNKLNKETEDLKLSLDASKEIFKKKLEIRKIGNEGGGLAVYIRKTIAFRTLEKLSNNNKHIESLSVEIIRKNQKNIILSCICRPPRGDQNIFTSKIKYLIERYKQNQKSLNLVDDLDLNSLDCTANNHVQNCFNLDFERCFFFCDKLTHKNYENKCNCN